MYIVGEMWILDDDLNVMILTYDKMSWYNLSMIILYDRLIYNEKTVDKIVAILSKSCLHILGKGVIAYFNMLWFWIGLLSYWAWISVNMDSFVWTLVGMCKVTFRQPYAFPSKGIHIILGVSHENAYWKMALNAKPCVLRVVNKSGRYRLLPKVGMIMGRGCFTC